MGKQRCKRVSDSLLQPISEGTSGPPRPAPQCFTQMGVRDGWHCQGLEERKTKCMEFPHSVHKHPVRHGFPTRGGSAAPSGGPEALQGSQGTLPDKTGVTLESLPPSTAGGQGNHPASFSSLLPLGLESAGTEQLPGVSSVPMAEVCTAALTQGCLTLLHGAFPSQLHLQAFKLGRKQKSLQRLAQVSCSIDPEFLAWGTGSTRPKPRWFC